MMTDLDIQSFGIEMMTYVGTQEKVDPRIIVCGNHARPIETGDTSGEIGIRKLCHHYIRKCQQFIINEAILKMEQAQGQQFADDEAVNQSNTKLARIRSSIGVALRCLSLRKEALIMFVSAIKANPCDVLALEMLASMQNESRCSIYKLYTSPRQ